MARGLTEAQIVERLERLERNLRLLAERASFVDAQRVVNDL